MLVVKREIGQQMLIVSSYTDQVKGIVKIIAVNGDEVTLGIDTTNMPTLEVIRQELHQKVSTHKERKRNGMPNKKRTRSSRATTRQ